jgi:hypothetical protein
LYIFFKKKQHSQQHKYDTMAKGGKSATKKVSGVKSAMSVAKNPAKRAHVNQTFGLPGQIANNAGGFSFPLGLRTECLRYLILGGKGPNSNFYQTAGQVDTAISRAWLLAISKPDTFKQLLGDLVDVSVAGRAPKQEPTMMALAACIVFAPDAECKKLALDAIAKVCRIPTHLFMLVENVRGLSQDKPGNPGKGMGAGFRKALTDWYASRHGEELAVLLTKYKNREGWRHEDIFRLIHLNPASLKDDGARLVFEFFILEDKPQRKTRDGKVLPASTARTDFLRRLATIPTPALPEDEKKPVAVGGGGLLSSISSAIGSVFGGGSAAAAAQPAVKVVSPPRSIQVLFEVVHPDSPLSGALKLMVQDTEPLHNLRQTLNDIGIGTSFVFRYNGCLISSTKSLRDISYDPTKKIYLGAGVEPDVPVEAKKEVAAAPAPAPAPAAPEEPVQKKTREDPLTAAARFLKACVEIAKTGDTKNARGALAIMKSNPRLQREHIPTQLMSFPDIWASLIEGMGMTALIRNLGKISSIGIMPQFREKICATLLNKTEITKSRVHPIQVLIALKTYMAGKGDLGKLTWTTDRIVLDTLSTTFKMAFGNVERTGQRIMLALDVSGSMDCATAGAPSVTCREAATAMAMITLATEGEANTHIYAFTTTFMDMRGRIKPNSTVQDAIRATNEQFGGTDCAVPIRHAKDHNIPVDCFIVYTDSETYAPTKHPQVELEEYRKKTGINAKLIVVGMVANSLTIADPSDKNTLNLAGFDSALPQLITMFLKGEI